MATAYTSLIRARPAAESVDFLNWCRELAAARDAEIPVVRATTYYFSTSGDDDTGDGSQANPYKTLAKATAVADDNTALLFKCGDTWTYDATDNPGIDLDEAVNVTVGSYGTGEKPRFDGFIAKYPAATEWTQHDTSTNCWYVSEASDIGHVRRQVDLYTAPSTWTPLHKAASLAALDAYTSDGWFYDGTADRLYLKVGGDPAGTAWEATPLWSAGASYALGHYCIKWRGDGVRVQGIRIDGWAAHTGKPYPIYFEQSTNDGLTAVVKDCEVYYGAKHNIGMAPVTGTGSVFTVIGCKMAFVNDDDSLTVGYLQNGGQEYLVYDCDFYQGKIPDADAWTAKGLDVFAHTNGGEAVNGLTLFLGNRTHDLGKYGVRTSCLVANAPTCTSTSDVLTLIVGQQTACSHFTPVANRVIGVAQPASLTINSDFRYKMVSTGYVSAIADSTQPAWIYNSRLTLDLSGAAFGGQLFRVGNATGTFPLTILHSEFRYLAHNGNLLFDLHAGARSGSFKSANNLAVAIRTGTGTVTAGMSGNNADRGLNNAYYDCVSTGTGGYASETGEVVLLAAPTSGARPNSASQLYRAGAVSSFSIDLGYDLPGGRRDTAHPTIGPLRHYFPEPGLLNGGAFGLGFGY